MIIRIKTHSVVDLITNSSTSIFTWYNGSDIACREMVNEFIKAFEIKGVKFDDIFLCDVFCEAEEYLDYYENTVRDKNKAPKLSDKELKDLLNDIIAGKTEKPQWLEELPVLDYEDLEQLIADVLEGTKKRPDWMIECENSGSRKENDFVLKVKNAKYIPLAKAIENFLKTPESDVEYDG